MNKKNLESELWRSYLFGERMHTIHNPVELYYREGGSTHRVLDKYGIVHCVPAPGFFGCVLQWRAKPGQPAVAF